MIHVRVKEILKEQNKSKYWLIKNMERSDIKQLAI